MTLVWARGDGSGCFWVGPASHAADEGFICERGVRAIINCCHIDFPWVEELARSGGSGVPAVQMSRIWLNINFKGSNWWQRFNTSIMLALTTLMAGNSVLAHCIHGRHRSGAFAVCVLALLKNISVKEAQQEYFHLRQATFRSSDKQRVCDICSSMRLHEVANS